jgi:hypothetical protein
MRKITVDEILSMYDNDSGFFQSSSVYVKANHQVSHVVTLPLFDLQLSISDVRKNWPGHIEKRFTQPPFTRVVVPQIARIELLRDYYFIKHEYQFPELLKREFDNGIPVVGWIAFHVTCECQFYVSDFPDQQSKLMVVCDI